MDFFEEPNNPPPKQAQLRRRPASWIWNLLTLLLVLGALGFATLVAMIYTNPASALNPFPLPTQVPTLFIPTHLPLATQILPTSVIAGQAGKTPIPQPTQPELPTSTAFAATPLGPANSSTPPTATPRSSSFFSFVIQAEPRTIESSLFNPGRGCNWMGVAGQVVDLKNSPVALGIIVQLGGSVGDKVINVTSLTGTATQYGTAGYEITLADKPVASRGQLWIRLLNQEGIAISDKIVFDTSSDCSKNLMIINFKQVK
jgi:hypothetical protein